MHKEGKNLPLPALMQVKIKRKIWQLKINFIILHRIGKQRVYNNLTFPFKT